MRHRNSGPGHPATAPGIAALVGAIAGATVVGFAILARSLLAGAVGPSSATSTPGWPWWLGPTPYAVPVVAAVVAGVVVVGAVAGLAARRHPARGVAVLLVPGAVSVLVDQLGGSAAITVLIPVISTLAGVICLVALCRLVRPAGSSAEHHEVDGTDGSPDDPNGAPVSRRTALVIAAMAAVGAGAAGVVTTPARLPPARLAVGAEAARGAPLIRGTVINVRDLGASGDGRSDDSAAILEGLAAANRVSGTLLLPAGVYRYTAQEALSIGAGVTVAGEPGATTIEFAPTGDDGFALLFGIEAADITIDGVEIRRAGDFDVVLIGTGAFERFTLSRSTLVGNMDLYPDRSAHGIMFSNAATSSGLHIVDCTFRTTAYGLLQTNASTSQTTDILVERCSFGAGTNTALEFNTPNGTMRDVRVQDCTFSSNAPVGFGVGLAKVDGAVVQRNYFEGYAIEAVHIEDYSTNVLVQNNTFIACGLREHSHVQIIGGAQDIRVTGNYFYAAMNTSEIHIVTSQPGGVGPTPSGRPTGPPSRVAFHGNTLECSASVTPAYVQGSTGCEITENVISGAGLSGPADAFELLEVDEIVIGRNVINGTRY